MGFGQCAPAAPKPGEMLKIAAVSEAFFCSWTQLWSVKGCHVSGNSSQALQDRAVKAAWLSWVGLWKVLAWDPADFFGPFSKILDPPVLRL